MPANSVRTLTGSTVRSSREIEPTMRAVASPIARFVAPLPTMIS